MTTLLIHSPTFDDAPSGETLFGGQPSAPPGAFEWPKCRTCHGNMQFLGQLRVSPDQLLLLFMCQNDPGGCNEWSPDEGNKVISVIPQNLQSVTPPDDGKTLRDTRYGAIQVQSDAHDYHKAASQWASTNDKPMSEVLGQMGGNPSWIQNEEIPTCEACGNPMSFVAQLEQGPDYKTAMNFGSGCAYVFRCRCSQDSAKWLWQC